MTRAEFLRKFEENLAPPAEPGSLSGPEICEDLDGWDSLAVLGLIAMVNKELGLTLAPDRIFAAETVDQIIELVADRLTPDAAPNPA